MTLPWFLNPWAEVRRLRRDVRTWKEDSKYWSGQWDADSRRLGELQDENAELKRKVGELHVYCSCLEGKGVVRHVPPSSEELLKRVQGDPRAKFCL